VLQGSQRHASFLEHQSRPEVFGVAAELVGNALQARVWGKPVNHKVAVVQVGDWLGGWVVVSDH
jgi:hypothetical protein